MSKSFWQGEKVRLRAVEPEDWQTHYDWDQDTETLRRLDYIWPPASREAARRWADETSRERAKDDRYHFQIETLEGELVGALGIHSTDQRCGTFSYGIAVRENCRGRGYAAEAIRLVLRYYFEELRYQKVTVHIYSFNEPSLRLHESLGFQHEGRLRRMVYTEGRFHDEIVLGLTAEEFAASYEPITESRKLKAES